MNLSGRYALLLAVVLMGLTGCSAKDDVNPALASPTAPSTKSSITALEATSKARAAFEQYLTTVAAVEAEQGRRSERLAPYLEPEALKSEREGIAYLVKRGWHIEGRTLLAKFELQRFDQTRGQLSAYACVDLSRNRVIDRQGKDVTPGTRIDRQTSLPVFQVVGANVRMLRDSDWSGKSIC